MKPAEAVLAFSAEPEWPGGFATEDGKITGGRDSLGTLTAADGRLPS